MRIGIDATCWLNGRGFGRFTRELLTAIAEVGTSDEFILFADRQTAERAQFPAGWRVVVGETAVAPVEAAAADGRRSLSDLWVMRRIVRREPLDVLFFPAVYSYFPVGGRVPCVVTFHDVIAETLPALVFQSRRSRWFWSAKSRLAIRRANRVLTVSEASKRGLAEYFHLPDERISVISEAPSAVFRPMRRPGEEHRRALERHGLQAAEPFILYVGGISPHKNIEVLIEAFAQVLAKVPDRALRLVLVGNYAGDVFRTCYEDLRSMAADLGAVDRVSFAGFVPDEDLAHLYTAAQVFVLPSFLEGFGLPAVEAMACGAPVVASDRGSLPEVLDGAGELFDPSDATALARCLHRIVADAALREEMSTRGLNRAEQFSWERSARQTLDVLYRAAAQEQR